MSDHMLTIEWNKVEGWASPKIVPYQNLSISPAASCLHYGTFLAIKCFTCRSKGDITHDCSMVSDAHLTSSLLYLLSSSIDYLSKGLQCFEGLKAYKSLNDDSIRLFRPEKNMARLSNSMARLQMPGFDFNRQELIQCISELVTLDERWIPDGEGYSLYLRPTVIATHKFLGLAAPDSLLLYVITSPVGPYYKSGFNPIRLTADTSYVRAWPGGTGNSKVGGNYAPTMKPAADAAKDGYSQILWLFGENDEVTEVGAMNVFFYLINKETKRPELVTAPLTRGDILPGVTRASVLDLCRSWGDFDVSERFPTMHEIKEAADDNRLLEVFGAGTAAVVTPISCIQYKGKDIEIPAVGDVTKRVWDEITGIQYGKIEGPPGWSVKVEPKIVGKD